MSFYTVLGQSNVTNELYIYIYTEIIDLNTPPYVLVFCKAHSESSLCFAEIYGGVSSTLHSVSPL